MAYSIETVKKPNTEAKPVSSFQLISCSLNLIRVCWTRLMQILFIIMLEGASGPYQELKNRCQSFAD